MHRLHLPTWCNPKDGAQFLATLETYAFPRMCGTLMTEVSSADVLAALSPIWTAKAETARQVKQRIGTVMKWGMAQGWRNDNPAETVTSGLPRAEKQKVSRAAMPYKGYRNFLSALQVSKAGLSLKLALEFLVLTAARSGEVRGAT